MTDEHLKNLGRVATNFQFLEKLIAVWTRSLIGPDQAVGQMITVQLPFGKLCVLACSLFDYRLPNNPVAERFTGLIKQSLKLEEQRNQVFHSAWLTDDNTGYVSRLKQSLKLGKGLSLNSQPVPAEEIDKLADDMKGFTHEFMEIIKRFNEA